MRLPMSTTSMKPSALAQKRLLLPLLTAPVVTFALTLLLLQPVQAQQSQRRVSLPNQDYTESTQDLAVKVAGGRAVINRTWSWGRWYLNDAWADLSLRSAPDSLGASPGQAAPIIAIGRAERIYKRVTAATLAAAEAGKASTARQDCHAALAAGAVKAGDIWRLNENNAIRALGQAEHITGWQWYDQAGNTIDYDAQGRMQSWSSPAGVKTSLIRDEAGRILGVKDHAGRQVISIDYGGGLLPVRVQDTEGHSVSYEWQPLPAPIQASGNAAAALAHARLLKASDARGGVWHYEYSAGGHISRRTDPEGGQIKLEYYPVSVDTITRPASGSGSAGGGGGAIAPMPGPCDHASALNRPSLIARVHSLTDEAGRKTEYEVGYEHIRREYRIAVSLPGGAQQRLRFDHTGRLIENTLAGMQLMHVQRLDKNSEAITDARGQTTRIWYDSALTRRPVKIIWPDGSSESNEYDAAGRRIRHTSPLGVVSAWSYGERGQALTHTEAVGLPEERTWRWRYDSLGQRTQSTLGAKDGRGSDALTEHYAYDSWGNLTEMRDAAGHSSRASYNSQGLITSETDPLGHTRRLEYDAAGNLTSETDPLGHTRRYAYDARGRLTSITSASGHQQTARYDKAGQLVAWRNAQGQQSRIDYAENGLPQTLTQPSGAQWKASYTEAGQIASLTDPAGNTIAVDWGQKTGSPSALMQGIQTPGWSERYGYNLRGQRTQTIQTPNASDSSGNTSLITGQAWDAEGKLISATDAQGNTTLHEYDALARPTKTTDALGGVTQQSWDAQGRLLSVTDPLGHIYRFEYDPAGRLIKETNPLGQTTEWQYDPAGQPTQRTAADGSQTRYEWNKAGQLISLSTHAPHGAYPPDASAALSENIRYSYDADGQLSAYEQKDANGQLISSARYQRDEQGRITQTSLTYAKADGSTFTHTIGQSYTADGQLQSQSWPDGSRQDFAWEKGRLKQISLPDQSRIALGAYQWLIPGQIELPAGARITQKPDAFQRLAQLQVTGAKPQGAGASAAQLLQRRYSRNPAGHITRIESEEGASAYTYDRLGRLTQAESEQALQDKGLPNEAYSWDAAGNRLSSAHQAGAWTYNEANQLLQYPRALDENAPAQQSQTEQVSASYNAQGHLIKETGADWERNWRYNAAGRLSEIKDNADGLTVQYRYDPFGRRIAKTVTQGATSRTTYYINGESALMAEADEEGRLTRAYGFNPHTQQARTNEEDEDEQEGSLWSTDPIWQAELNGKTSLKEASYHYLVTDHLGAPVLALNKAGETTWKARYEAFGKARIDHASTAQINLRLPGQYFDAETGLHQNWNRDYAPGIGRYVQADPIGLAGGINVYEYAYGNPGAYIDPNGEFALVGAVVGGALNFGWQLWQNGGRIECINFWEVGVSALSMSGFGIIGRGGLAGIAGFFTNTEKFRKYSKAYWKIRGGAKNMSLDHWMISQAAARNGKVSAKIVDGGWNLLEMPKTWNRWLGFAPNWKNRPLQRKLAIAARVGIQIGIPGIAITSGVAGYKAGLNAQEEKCGC